MTAALLRYLRPMGRIDLDSKDTIILWWYHGISVSKHLQKNVNRMFVRLAPLRNVPVEVSSMYPSYNNYCDVPTT